MSAIRKIKRNQAEAAGFERDRFKWQREKILGYLRGLYNEALRRKLDPAYRRRMAREEAASA